MASSVTQICNTALVAWLGQAKIASINEGSTEANACLLFYETARDYTLQTALWGFARVFAELNENLTNDLEEYWAYSYEVPSDNLRIVRVLPEGGNPFDRTSAVKHKRAGDNLYTDEPGAWIYYIKQATDATDFSPAFAEAVSWKLAQLIVQPLRLESRLMQEMEAGFLRAVSRAIALDEAEEPFVQNADEAQAEWHRGR